MKLKGLVLVLGLCFVPFLAAQEEIPVWNLNSCVAFAKEHNITIKQSRVRLESSTVDVKQAKAAYWPNLSFSVGQNYSNQPYGVVKNSYSGNYGFNASWTVFDGSRPKNIDQQQLNEQIAVLDVIQEENTITEAIIRVFTQILYAQEAVTTNNNTVAVSAAQRDRSLELYNSGAISVSDYTQIVSQYSTDVYTLTTSQASLRNYQLQLKQLLELNAEVDMMIDSVIYPEKLVLSPLPSRTAVYEAALGIRPEIASSKINIEVSELSIDKAKASYLPSLSLSAGSGLLHSTASDFTFSEQLKSNWSNSIGVSLSVPIVSGRTTKSAVEKAKLQKVLSDLSYLDQQKTLLKTIDSFWLDAQSAQDQYRAAMEKKQATQVSYDLVNEQFNLGMKTATDLLSAKNNYMASQQEVLQAKYMAIYNTNMLRFYQGEPLK